jgi:hypothetical protein
MYRNGTSAFSTFSIGMFEKSDTSYTHRNTDRVEPLLYETVILSLSFKPDATFRTAARRSHSFLLAIKPERAKELGKHIRNLYLDTTVSPRTAERILSLCVNLVDLTYWTEHPTHIFLPFVKSNRVRSLSIHTRNVFRTWADVNFSSSSYANLSHLDLAKDMQQTLMLPKLHLLPSLTHLAIDGQTDMCWINGTLRECKRLEVLVLRKNILGKESINPVPQDSRVVLMESHYWFSHDNWVRMWAHADALVAEAVAS